MTIEELKRNHYNIYEEEIDGADEIEQHTNLSIEYTISVLEEIKPYYSSTACSEGHVFRAPRVSLSSYAAGAAFGAGFSVRCVGSPKTVPFSLPAEAA